ncbi:MAG: mandelate racemase/muconate lactonizing enzyme family protein [bacterium]
MNITKISTTPLSCAFRQPLHSARGVFAGATVILIELTTDEGVTGIGESVARGTAQPLLAILHDAAPLFAGRSLYDANRILGEYRTLRAPDMDARALWRATAGIEMAWWDALGKAAGQPVHRMFGGPLRDRISYFGFVQGGTPHEEAQHARALAADGFPVLYVKIGHGEERDVEAARAVREAIGGRRLRFDANEAWDMPTARRMLRKLKPFDPEFIEQPLPASGGAEALAQLRALVDVPIAADQCVNTPEEAYEVCRTRAADLIVLSVHRAGGLLPLRSAAAVAQAAGLKVCLHATHETGVTACAVNQVAAAIPNLDDANQIGCQLLVEDIVERPSLTLSGGTLPVSTQPGLGFELNRDAVARAAEAFQAHAGRTMAEQPR